MFIIENMEVHKIDFKQLRKQRQMTYLLQIPKREKYHFYGNKNIWVRL